MAVEDFILFNRDIPKDAHPIIAGILSEEVNDFAFILNGQPEAKQEYYLTNFFYKVSEVTGQNVKEGSESYLTDLVTKSWRNLATGVKPNSGVMVIQSYYYLHTNKAGKPIAERIDREIFDGQTFEKAFGREVPGGYIYKSQPASVPPVQIVQLRLSGARIHEHPAHYSNREIDVLGRDEERTALRAFANASPGFRWLQLAGEGGQGKSCLAQDLIEHQKRDMGWRAGFLLDHDRDAFDDKWNEWWPDKHHLIVFDYVAGIAEKIGKIMHVLSSRITEFEDKGIAVRVLLLERQRWDKGGLDGGLEFTVSEHNKVLFALSEGRAEWFLELQRSCSGHTLTSKKFLDERSVIELKALSPDKLVEIIEKLFHSQKKHLNHSPEFIKEAIVKIDKSGRPLYAYFLQTALDSGAYRKGWDRDKLLQHIIANNREKRWKDKFKHSAPTFDASDSAWNLALLSTIIEYLDCRILDDVMDCGIEKPDDHTLKQALLITEGPFGENGPLGERSSIISGLQPDILGEYLLVQAFKTKTLRPQLFIAGWRLNAPALSTFLMRLAEDFADSPIVTELFEILPETEARAALSGFAAGMSVIAECYAFGEGVDKDVAEAMRWWKKAAEAGDANAMHNLALSHLTGTWIEPDIAIAWKWWFRAAEKGHIKAMNNLGTLYMVGIEGAPDADKSFNWISKAANAGLVMAMYNLGSCYYNGTGVAADVAMALHWWRRAAEAGHATAMYELGVCYSEGKGIIFDLSEAACWWRKSAEAGFAEAMHNLGNCYYKGWGVETNTSEAMYWWIEAAKAGDIEAMNILGTHYAEGKGVEVDLNEAAYWWRKASEGGSPSAMYNLGNCYAQGIIGEPDFIEAIRWWREAADAGIGAAMYCLGLCYQKGYGVEQSLVEALYWFKRARDAGFNE